MLKKTNVPKNKQVYVVHSMLKILLGCALLVEKSVRHGINY